MIAISCNKESVKTEQEQALDYLLANGFSKGAINTNQNLTPQKIYSLNEAKEIVRQLKAIESTQEGDIILVAKSNSKTALYTCDEPGSYYISRALKAAVSGVDVSYRINGTGGIEEINSFATGLTLAWSWEQVGVSLLN